MSAEDHNRHAKVSWHKRVRESFVARASFIFAAVVTAALVVALIEAINEGDATATLGVAALVVALWVLRGVDPRRLRTIKAAGVELGYDETIAEAGAALTEQPTAAETAAEARRQAAEEGNLPGPSGGYETRGGSAPPAHDPARQEAIRRRLFTNLAKKRLETERLIEASALAGFDIAASGMFRDRPRPVIQWTDKGPVIAYWTTEPKEPSHDS